MQAQTYLDMKLLFFDGFVGFEIGAVGVVQLHLQFHNLCLHFLLNAGNFGLEFSLSIDKAGGQGLDFNCELLSENGIPSRKYPPITPKYTAYLIASYSSSLSWRRRSYSARICWFSAVRRMTFASSCLRRDSASWYASLQSSRSPSTRRSSISSSWKRRVASASASFASWRSSRKRQWQLDTQTMI